MDISEVLVKGRITSDTILYGNGGKSLWARFSVVTNSNYKDKNGNAKSTFHNVIAWGNCAEYLQKFCDDPKGREILYRGLLEDNNYINNKTGKEVKDKAEQLTQIIYIGAPKGGYTAKDRERAKDNEAATTYVPKSTINAPDNVAVDISDSDLPF